MGYDSSLGRFVQRDPIGYADGMNVYQYTRSNPVNSVDPSGLAANDSDGPIDGFIYYFVGMGSTRSLSPDLENEIKNYSQYRQLKDQLAKAITRDLPTTPDMPPTNASAEVNADRHNDDGGGGFVTGPGFGYFSFQLNAAIGTINQFRMRASYQKQSSAIDPSCDKFTASATNITIEVTYEDPYRFNTSPWYKDALIRWGLFYPLGVGDYGHAFMVKGNFSDSLPDIEVERQAKAPPATQPSTP